MFHAVRAAVELPLDHRYLLEQIVIINEIISQHWPGEITFLLH